MSWRQSTSAMAAGPGTSRAINIDAAQADVQAACDKKSIEISTIETLLSGGTRVVLVNTAGADKLRTAFKSKIMLGPVARTRWVANH